MSYLTSGHIKRLKKKGQKIFLKIFPKFLKKGTYRISLVGLFRELTPFPLINPKKNFCGEALLYGPSTQKKISKFYVVTYVVNRFFASRGFIIGLFYRGFIL